MKTVIVEYNPKNIRHLSIIEMLKTFGLIKSLEEKSSYNKKFVEKIKESEQEIEEGKGKPIKTDDLWK